MKRIVSFLFLFVFLFISCPVNHSPSHPKAPVYTLTLLKSEGSEEVYKEYYNKGDKWYYDKECTKVIKGLFKSKKARIVPGGTLIITTPYAIIK